MLKGKHLRIFLEWKVEYEANAENFRKQLITSKDTTKRILEFVFYINIDRVIFFKSYHTYRIYNKAWVYLHLESGSAKVKNYKVFSYKIDEFIFVVNWYHNFLFYSPERKKTLQDLAMMKMIENRICNPYSHITWINRQYEDLKWIVLGKTEDYVSKVIFIKKIKWLGNRTMTWEAFEGIQEFETAQFGFKDLQNNYSYNKISLIRHELLVKKSFIKSVNIYKYFVSNVDLRDFHLYKNKEIVVFRKFKQIYIKLKEIIDCDTILN